MNKKIYFYLFIYKHFTKLLTFDCITKLNAAYINKMQKYKKENEGRRN